MAFARKSAKPKAFLNEAGLYDYAVKALGRQMRSEAELRRLMTARAEPGARGEAAVAAVVARLKETAISTIGPLPRPMPACARKTRSWASGACARLLARRA